MEELRLEQDVVTAFVKSTKHSRQELLHVVIVTEDRCAVAFPYISPDVRRIRADTVDQPLGVIVERNLELYESTHLFQGECDVRGESNRELTSTAYDPPCSALRRSADMIPATPHTPVLKATSAYISSILLKIRVLPIVRVREHWCNRLVVPHCSTKLVRDAATLNTRSVMIIGRIIGSEGELAVVVHHLQRH